MKTLISLLIFITSGFSFAHESTKIGKTPAADILDKVLQVHKNSKTYGDWHYSGWTPEDVIPQLIARDVSLEASKGLCLLFDNMNETDAALFYQSIVDSTKYPACLSATIEKVRVFWKNSQKKIKLQQMMSNNNLSYLNADSTPLGPTTEVDLDASDGPLLVYGDLKPGEVVLTFDDGPHQKNTQLLLDVLDAELVKATFFQVGRNMKLYPDVVKDVAARGHGVGTHSFTHAKLSSLKYAKAISEISSAFNGLFDILGQAAPLFRFPYGASNKKLRAYLKNHGVAEYFWAIDTLDWKKTDPSDLYNFALAETIKQGRGIILFHDIQPQTIAMMPAFLDALQANGFKTVNYRPIAQFTSKPF